MRPSQLSASSLGLMAAVASAGEHPLQELMRAERTLTRAGLLEAPARYTRSRTGSARVVSISARRAADKRRRKAQQLARRLKRARA